MLDLKGIKKAIKEKKIRIKFDLTPQASDGLLEAIIGSQQNLALLNELASARKGCYFYIDVWDSQATLHLMKNDKFSSEDIGVVKEIPNELLVEAVEEQGALNISGEYVINAKIKRWLKKQLSDEK